MKLKVKKINFETGNIQDVILHIRDANKLGRKSGDRIIIKNPESKSLENKYNVAILQIGYSDSIISPGEIGVFMDSVKHIDKYENKIVSVKPADLPESFKYISKKINGNKLNSVEINELISDATSGLLSPIELASFITAVSINGMDDEEMTALSLAESKSGTIFDFGPKVFDKHSTHMVVSTL
jgi:AMP phosphorylase